MAIQVNNTTIIDDSRNILNFKSVKETINVSATAATGNISYNLLDQTILYYTANSSANFTVNIRGNTSTSLNSIMSNGDVLTAVFMITNNTTPYYQTALQIDGSAVTPKWQGGTAPTSGNASSIDSYTYTIIKTANAAYSVLASQTKFS